MPRISSGQKVKTLLFDVTTNRFLSNEVSPDMFLENFIYEVEIGGSEYIACIEPRGSLVSMVDRNGQPVCRGNINFGKLEDGKLVSIPGADIFNIIMRGCTCGDHDAIICQNVRRRKYVYF